jgi:hypothetical protein
MRLRGIITLLAILFVFTCLPFAQEAAKKAMTNQDVLDIVGLGLGDDVVIEKIRTAPETAFDTSISALKALKEAKVSEAVIKTMISPKAPVAVASSAVPEKNPDIPDDVGIYVKHKNKISELQPEVVGWRTGGVLKSMATYGMTKGHTNGTVQGPKSVLQIPSSAEFIIKCPEGTAISEYQLLKLDEKGDRREFRAFTGGVVHASQGAEKNAVQYDFEKVAPRVYKVKLLPLKKGEYGFLPPGSTSGNLASSGKLYSFGIVE